MPYVTSYKPELDPSVKYVFHDITSAATVDKGKFSFTVTKFEDQILSDIMIAPS